MTWYQYNKLFQFWLGFCWFECWEGRKIVWGGLDCLSLGHFLHSGNATFCLWMFTFLPHHCLNRSQLDLVQARVNLRQLVKAAANSMSQRHFFPIALCFEPKLQRNWHAWSWKEMSLCCAHSTSKGSDWGRKLTWIWNKEVPPRK